LYATHRLKGIEYSLPFSVVASPVPVASPVASPVENEFEVVANKPPSKPVGTWDDLKVVRTKSKPLVIKEKRPHPKKHTLSILLTQEKEKTRKLQDMLKQTISEDQDNVIR
jgi:galactose-1-phosphate uridylyltransferase